jgi:hypothetical protein
MQQSVAQAAGKMAAANAADFYGCKQPAIMTGGTLKPYQLEGVRWLMNLFQNGESLERTLICLSGVIVTTQLQSHPRHLLHTSWLKF